MQDYVTNSVFKNTLDAPKTYFGQNQGFSKWPESKIFVCDYTG